jgi:hypothetical protein
MIAVLAATQEYSEIGTPAVVKVPKAPWSGGKPGQCYENVLEMIRLHGGKQVFGWALAEFGPLATEGRHASPLYRRWVNHVVWSDAAGNLWEVSPCATVEDESDVTFQDTEFIPDSSAMLGRTTLADWFRTSNRYVPVCHEGIEAAKYLTLAQAAASQGEMVQAIQNAVKAVGAAGFQPGKVVVQNIAGNTTNIWIYADFVEWNPGVEGLRTSCLSASGGIE